MLINLFVKETAIDARKRSTLKAARIIVHCVYQAFCAIVSV
ncbi:MAG: hypothetical protein ACFFB7_01890 [Candidatus Sifarchaeia archaeon]